MTITLELILSGTGILSETVSPSDTFLSRKIEGLRLLPHNCKNCTANCLYITRHISHTQLQNLSEDIPVLLCSRKSEDLPFPDNILPVISSADYASVFNRIQEYWSRLTDWERQLDYAVSQNSSFQDFIDIYNQLSDAPVLIFDPALKLLAWSKKTESLKDRMFQTTVHNGYLDFKSVKYFEASNTFSEINRTGISFGEADAFREHSDLTAAINIQNQLAVYAVLLYTETYSRTLTTQLFQILCSNLYRLLKKQHNLFHKERSVTDYFLTDLLNNPETSVEQIKDRLSYSDLDFKGNYILLSLHSEISKKSSENYFIQYIRNNLIGCRIFPYQNNIVILYLLPATEVKNYRHHLTHRFSRLLKDFSQHHPRLYVSRPFPDISFFCPAYIQAENTFQFSGNAGDTLMHFYEDIWIKDLILQNPVKQRCFFYCESCLMEMLNENSRKSLRNYNLLRCFLLCERSFSRTAALQNMHRNNVIYHIHQIEKQYNLDLDNADFRFRLLLSYQILDSAEYPES